jgi:hypothetical protein
MEVRVCFGAGLFLALVLTASGAGAKPGAVGRAELLKKDYKLKFHYVLMIIMVSKETLNNYLRCQGRVKNRLKMLIYYQ